ncbi:hypothetical protein GTW51_13950 [Aurantimonas aggregata]|uniref:Alkyl sulfatase C-terminal domain-containing protein n=1 Tax=Aurantimonas aggregata TaxID=2047720 RepID=A0A6L9MJ63_9HYPH|nr:hypothetical protein [Aurantimonas aggregata]NDV87805.1 hypothetical protein [Aurantimonas aggregata]
MGSDARLRQGTTAWFEMVGTMMCEAATRAALSTALSLSLVERYTEGVELSDGLVQGLRFDIVAGTPSFRAGVQPNERAAVTIEITAAAARTLNLLRSDDPAFHAALDGFRRSGAMRVDGDPSQFGRWLEQLHDPIVALTR